MEPSRCQSEIRRKPRVLCLHGLRDNGKFLEDKIRSRWPESVVDELDLVFPNAPFAAAEAGTGIDGVAYEWFQIDQDFKKFYNFEECLNFLEKYMSKHGPFDGILGISQGAFLAGSLPGIQKSGVAFTKIPRIKFFILIAGGKFGYKRFGVPKPATDAYISPADSPSLHIIGEGDTLILKDESEALLDCFVDPTVIYHPDGHIIPPLAGENLKKMQEFIQAIKRIPVHENQH